MTPRVDPSEQGFSLVELLVVMVILGVVASVTMAMVISAFGSQRRQVEHVGALNTAKIGLERLTRDVRQANPLTAAETDGLELVIVESGISRTESWLVGTTAGDRRLVRCTTTLAACTVADGQAMASGLATSAGSTTFAYFDEDGTEIDATIPLGMATMDTVRSIEVRLRVPRTDAPEVELTNLIELRNGGA